MSPTVDRPVCSSRDSALAVVVIVVFWLLVQKILEKIHFLIFFVYLCTQNPVFATCGEAKYDVRCRCV